MQYDHDEVEGLVQLSQDQESLSELELRLAIEWMLQQKRDGKSLKEIKEQIVRESK